MISALLLAADSSALASSEPAHCGYAGKHCTNARTSKKGGGLHRFCEFHRLRANQNQWRVDRKRRAIRAFRRQQLKRCKTLESGPLPLPDPVELTTDATIVTLEDVVVLEALLFPVPSEEIATPATLPPSWSQVGVWV